MTIQNFIAKAIQGGWKLPHQDLTDEKIHRIRIKWSFWMGLRLVGGARGTYGWRDVAIISFKDIDYYLPIAEMVLDPLAWQAVGKVEGWEKISYCRECEVADSGYKGRMHRMIDALAEGKTIEEFISTL